jgi:hypothetical protein
LKLKHRINISVKHPDGKYRTAVKGGEVRIRERFLRFLLGRELNVIVIAPGDSVYGVEIHEKLIPEPADLPASQRHTDRRKGKRQRTSFCVR